MRVGDDAAVDNADGSHPPAERVLVSLEAERQRARISAEGLIGVDMLENAKAGGQRG